MMSHFKLYSIGTVLIMLCCYACHSGGRSNDKLADKPNKIKPVVITFPIVDSLKALFAIADTIQHSYGENDTTDRVGDLNDVISETLHRILLDTAITRQNMDTILNIQGLNITHADDKLLWIFDWYENTGGSFKSNLSIVYYRTAAGRSIVSYGYQGEKNSFHSAGAAYNSIYKLRAKNKNIYLCIGSGIGCTTCRFNTASVIELQKDSANFNYPAFTVASDDVITYGANDASCFTLGARDDDIQKFEFDPKTQKLHIAYLTDDNTPIQREDGHEQKRIVRELVFNGRKFVGDAFH